MRLRDPDRAFEGPRSGSRNRILYPVLQPEAGRGVNEIFETLLGSLVKGERKATAFSDGFAAMGLKLWRDAHIRQRVLEREAQRNRKKG